MTATAAPPRPLYESKPARMNSPFFHGCAGPSSPPAPHTVSGGVARGYEKYRGKTGRLAERDNSTRSEVNMGKVLEDAESLQKDFQGAAKAVQKKQGRIVDLLKSNPYSPPLVGPHRRLEMPLKRVVENLLKLGVAPAIVAAAAGLSYSCVMYHRRRVFLGRGRKK